MKGQLERRLGRLEAAAGGGNAELLDMLVDGGRGLITAHVENGGDLVELVDLATCGMDDPFAAERLRGVCPDKILAAVYNKRRNYAYPPEIARRVRELAGLYDANGKLRPEYVLRDNGCINDRDAPTYGVC